MTEIDVPDWVAADVLSRYSAAQIERSGEVWPPEAALRQRQEDMRAALTAALGAWVGPELDEYQRLRDGIGGCTDGGCVIKRPKGMHTNGGCKCWQDKIKAQRMMRAGQTLFDTLRQEKPE